MAEDPFYADPNPPAWPNNGIAFNRWYTDLPAFLARLRRFRWYGVGGKHRFKYVGLRIDTRNGNFLLTDGDGRPACPDEMFAHPGLDPAAAEAAERAYEKLAEICDHVAMVGTISSTNRTQMKSLAGILRKRKRKLAELDRLDEMMIEEAA